MTKLVIGKAGMRQRGAFSIAAEYLVADVAIDTIGNWWYSLTGTPDSPNTGHALPTFEGLNTHNDYWWCIFDAQKYEGRVDEFVTHPPYIGDDNYWYLWDFTTHQYVKDTYAKGDDLHWDEMSAAEKEELAQAVTDHIALATEADVRGIVDNYEHDPEPAPEPENTSEE